MIGFIKNNMFIRGLYFLYKAYFSVSRRKLGFCGPNVTLTPPLLISNPENVFLYGDESCYDIGSIL